MDRQTRNAAWAAVRSFIADAETGGACDPEREISQLLRWVPREDLRRMLLSVTRRRGWTDPDEYVDRLLPTLAPVE